MITHHGATKVVNIQTFSWKSNPGAGFLDIKFDYSVGVQDDQGEKDGELMADYLPLTEYSSKYRVSVSTLRRRIKAEDIQYSFEDGRYLILDEPMSAHQRNHRPSPKQTSDDSLMGASSQNSRVVSEVAPGFAPRLTEASLERTAATEEPILTAANRLLTELKKAYTQILQEKEEQILNLKAEVADLKTLVRVLEADNERVKKNLFE